MKPEALIPLLAWIIILAVAAWVRAWSIRRCERKAKERQREVIKRRWTQEERDTYEWLKSLNKREKR